MVGWRTSRSFHSDTSQPFRRLPGPPGGERRPFPARLTDSRSTRRPGGQRVGLRCWTTLADAASGSGRKSCAGLSPSAFSRRSSSPGWELHGQWEISPRLRVSSLTKARFSPGTAIRLRRRSALIPFPSIRSRTSSIMRTTQRALSAPRSSTTPMRSSWCTARNGGKDSSDKTRQVPTAGTVHERRAVEAAGPARVELAGAHEDGRRGC